jgi:tetratricopeptide (TPR) repeat protein
VERDPEILADLARVSLARSTQLGEGPETAVRYAESAIAADPASPLPYLDAAGIAITARRVDLATAYWEAARVRSRSPDALLRLGQVALELNDASSARVAFREAAQREWRRAYALAAYLGWGEAAVADGAPGEAAMAYASYLADQPHDASVRLKRASALAQDGQSAEALREAQRAHQDAPDYPEAQELVEQLQRS